MERSIEEGGRGEARYSYSISCHVCMCVSEARSAPVPSSCQDEHAQLVKQMPSSATTALRQHAVFVLVAFSLQLAHSRLQGVTSHQMSQ